jgi:hypothetical protein
MGLKSVQIPLKHLHFWPFFSVFALLFGTGLSPNYFVFGQKWFDFYFLSTLWEQNKQFGALNLESKWRVHSTRVHCPLKHFIPDMQHFSQYTRTLLGAVPILKLLDPEPFSYPARRFLHARDRWSLHSLHRRGTRIVNGHRPRDWTSDLFSSQPRPELGGSPVESLLNP